MLRFLRVRNFALIDQLELHFEEGFNLLSGETGAGKSIIVDALGLLAGSKASAEMVRTGESRAVVEAVFETDIRAELDRLGLDSEGNDVVVRREISSDERNRVYINNQPSTVSALRGVRSRLRSRSRRVRVRCVWRRRMMGTRVWRADRRTTGRSN